MSALPHALRLALAPAPRIFVFMDLRGLQADAATDPDTGQLLLGLSVEAFRRAEVALATEQDASIFDRAEVTRVSGRSLELAFPPSFVGAVMSDEIPENYAAAPDIRRRTLRPRLVDWT